MKLCRFDDHRLGVVEGEEVVDVTEVLAQLPAQRYPLPRHDLLIAHLPMGKVRKMYERHAEQPEVQAIGTTWRAFWATMKAIRQRGYYVSIQEVSNHSVGIAAPIALPDVGAVAVLSLVFPYERLPIINIDGLGARVSAGAHDIAAQLTLLTGERIE